MNHWGKAVTMTGHLQLKWEKVLEWVGVEELVSVRRTEGRALLSYAQHFQKSLQLEKHFLF